MSDSEQQSIDAAIAIVGMSGRFPGADSIEQFWNNLRVGTESVSFFTEQELADAGVSPLLLGDPSYVKASATIDNIDMFAASFFGFTPKEAEITDPQHRLFLECAWQALEDAGYVPDSFAGRIGVFAGAGFNTYMIRNLLSHRGLIESMGVLQLVIGNKADFMPTQVSYKLNLKGPSLHISTACSTSLVAVHMACRSLLGYECDMALAGGVSVQVPQKEGYLYQSGGVVSPDGHCRAFDSKAQGTVGGSGVGTVLLKRLEDAIADGDHIYAVIRGSAVNNDGAQKIGYTAPSVDGQQEVIATAMAVAEVDPQTITYMEAHGTGTTLGDPIEVRALTQAFRLGTDKNGYCAIGSVKSNVGHLDAAAGVASLIKAALCIEHGVLVPSINFEQPNPAIDFSRTPFYVNTALCPWPSTDPAVPRRAGVSSFGIGGTNAHVVLEQAPAAATNASARKWQLLPLSAQTESALNAASANLVRHLTAADQELADVAYTLKVGRKAFDHRRIVLCSDRADAERALQTRDPKRVSTGAGELSQARVAFMFPGIGDQYVNMAAGLYRNEPVFRRNVDRCAEFLRPLLGADVRDLLYPKDYVAPPVPEADGGVGFNLRAMLGGLSRPDSEHDLELRQTVIAHPALFTVEYALAQLWMEWGIVPTAMIGHSLGEYTAACVAGVMSVEDALTVVATRARLIQALPMGRMLAVALPADAVRSRLPQGLSIAAVNGRSLCVVSGPSELVAEYERQLIAAGNACRPVASAHAFHSTMMEPVRAALAALLGTIALRAPTIPYLSNATGTWITAAQATSPDYWAQHSCETVRFADGIATLAESDAILLEVGPGQSLSSFVSQRPSTDTGKAMVALPSLPGVFDNVSDEFCLARTLGSLWCLGKPIDWLKYHGHEQRRRVPLPTYPFERERYWIEPAADAVDRPVVAGGETKPSGVLYLPSWSRTPLSPAASGGLAERRCWLVFSDEGEVSASLLARLRRHQQDVVVVRLGVQFEIVADGIYTVNPTSLGDYQALAQNLRQTNALPRNVVHLWALAPGAETYAVDHGVVDAAYTSLLHFAQAFGAIDEQRLDLMIVSSDTHAVAGDERIRPEKATLLGPCRVVPLEFPRICAANIDVAPARTEGDGEAIVDNLLHEFSVGLPNDVVAYRGRQRWTPSYPAAVRHESPAPLLRRDGHYLVTDYRGQGVAHSVAEHLARQTHGTLVLLVQPDMPPQEEWSKALALATTPAPVKEVLNGVTELERAGAKVVLIDGAAAQDPAVALARLPPSISRLDGVIHVPLPFDYGLIQFREQARACAVTAEVTRVFALATRLVDLSCEFIALVSSNLGFAGAAGRVDYCAANAFLQAFADYLFRAYRLPTVSIVCDLRGDDSGSAAANGFPPALLKYIDTSRERYAIAADDARSVWPQVFTRTHTAIAVSSRDLATAIRQMRAETLSTIVGRVKGSQAKTSASAIRGVRPPYVAPETEVEQQVAGIWQSLFGISQIGLDDSFFGLGGSSLLAVQFVSRLREAFQVDVPLRALFQAPTVREVAAIIEGILIDEIEALSDAQVAQYRRDSEPPAAFDVDPTWYELPNKLMVQQFNQVETDHFYKDIFETKVYYKNGIVLPAGSIIFDVGANIGLFSLFAHRQCQGATIYAFEPAPPVFELLRRNTSANGVNVRLFNAGVSNRRQMLRLTFYPKSTGMSSFHADKEQEKQVLRAIMNNQLQEGVAGMTQVMEYADDILEERFRERTFDCELLTLSEVIAEHAVDRIDLLKIDVQKCELEVLEGIDAAHWPLIRQLVVEVHDIEGRADRVSALLKRHGYDVVVEQDSLYHGSNICNIYAMRHQAEAASRVSQHGTMNGEQA